MRTTARTEADDCLALWLLLNMRIRSKIAAVSTVHGNASLEVTDSITRRLVGLLSSSPGNATDVRRGSRVPIKRVPLERSPAATAKSGPFTHAVGSTVDLAFVTRCMRGVHTVLHTATPHNHMSRSARRELGWQPRYDFGRAITLVEKHEEPRSALAGAIGAKGYHAKVFEDAPYPVE